MEGHISYEIEGMIIEIPLYYDEQSGKHIEDYREFIEKQIFTPLGSPIMFAGEDSCEFCKEATPGGCPDCGSCIFYKRAGEYTWIGICKCDERIIKIRKNE